MNLRDAVDDLVRALRAEGTRGGLPIQIENRVRAVESLVMGTSACHGCGCAIDRCADYRTDGAVIACCPDCDHS